MSYTLTVPISNIDFIGRFENIEEDWKTLQNKFQFEELPDKSTQSHVTNQKLKLNKKQADKLMPLYEKDFEIFNYDPADLIE